MTTRKPKPKKRKPRTWWLTVLDDGWAYDVNTSRRAAERNKPDWPCSLVRVREVLR